MEIPIPLKSSWWYNFECLKCLSGRNSQTGCKSIWCWCSEWWECEEMSHLFKEGRTNVHDEEKKWVRKQFKWEITLHTHHMHICVCVYIYYLRSLKFTLKHLKRSYMFRSHNHPQRAYIVPCESYNLKHLVNYFVMLKWCCGSMSCFCVWAVCRLEWAWLWLWVVCCAEWDSCCTAYDAYP